MKKKVKQNKGLILFTKLSENEIQCSNGVLSAIRKGFINDFNKFSARSLYFTQIVFLCGISIVSFPCCLCNFTKVVLMVDGFTTVAQ